MPLPADAIRIDKPSNLPPDAVSVKQQAPELQEPQKQTAREIFGDVGVPEPVTKFVLEPLMEFERGFARGGESLFGKIDAVTELIAKSTGTTKGGLFEDFSQSMGNEAQNIPETGMHPFDKLSYQMAGGAIPIATEFAAIKVPGAIGQTFKGASEVTKFAVLGALEEYNKDPNKNLLSLAKGAAKGAATSMTFQTGAASLKLLHKTNKAMLKSFLTFVTGSKKAAKRLADNPRSLNLNPLGKVKSAPEIRQENQIAKDSLKTKIADEKFAFTQQQKTKQQLLAMQIRDKEKALALANADAKNNLAARQGLSLEEQTRKSAKAISDMNNAVKDKAVNLYDSALQKYLMIRKQAGEAVGNAVNATVNRNPGASIPYNMVNKKVNQTVKNMSPFKMNLKGKVIPRTGVSPKEEVATFQAFIDDFRSKRMHGGVSVKYLQDLKNDLKNLATKNFKAGNNRIGAMYSQLSKDVNPATLVSENKSLQKSLHEIASANKEFASMVPKYEAAMKNYFKQDASGNFIPDPERTFNAVARNDITVLRQMAKADALLPKNDQLLPQVKSLVSLSDRNIAHQKGITNSLKRQAKKEKNQLTKATRDAVNRLQKQGQQLTADARQKASVEIRNFSEGKGNEYDQFVKDLTKMEEIYEQQDLLRSFGASGKTGAGLLQHVMGFSALPALRTGSGSAVPLLGVAALSPIGASNLARVSLSATENLDAVLTPVLQNRTLQRLIGSSIIRQNTSKLQTKQQE